MARRDLTIGSIPHHFRALAVPAAAGMVFTTLYNVVDVYYAGMLGTEAQAGLAISFTVFFILFVAIGVGLSSAMGALVGHALGKRSGQEGLIAAQGGAELSLRLPEMRSEAGARQADVFARALWSQRGESLEINERSVQVGAGVRWQPVIGSAWRITAERLIAIGEDARDDWLLRLAWGAMVGDQPAPGRSYWPAGQVYVEAGRFFENGGSTALYGEGRFGMTTALGEGWMLTPHAVVAAREVRPDPSAESWAEAGLGLALRRAFGATLHSADRGRFEWLMQYRQGVSGAGRQGWLFAASILW